MAERFANNLSNQWNGGTMLSKDSDKKVEYLFERWLWSEISRNKGWIISGALLPGILITIVLYALS
jgi:hypothetical protein